MNDRMSSLRSSVKRDFDGSTFSWKLLWHARTIFAGVLVLAALVTCVPDLRAATAGDFVVRGGTNSLSSNWSCCIPAEEAFVHSTKAEDQANDSALKGESASGEAAIKPVPASSFVSRFALAFRTYTLGLGADIGEG